MLAIRDQRPNTAHWRGSETRKPAQLKTVPVFPPRPSKSAFLPTQPHTDCAGHKLSGRIPRPHSVRENQRLLACAAARLPPPFKRNPAWTNPVPPGSTVRALGCSPTASVRNQVSAQLLYPLRGVTIGYLIPLLALVTGR